MGHSAIKKNEQLGTDFTTGNITKHLIRFMLPLLLAGILNSLYNAIDTIVIGRYVGTAGNVAVSTGGKILMVITLFSDAMAGAGQVVLSQQIGLGRRKDIHKTIGTLFTMLAVMSVTACVLFLALSRNVITWLNTPENAFDGALAYMRITSLGMPLIFGYNACCSVLRGMGDSKRPLIFVAIAALVNLVLDLVFVIVLEMGAAGTAWATVIGQGTSFLFSVVYLYRRKAEFGFDFRLVSFKPDGKLVKLILKIGIPMSITGLFISVTQVFMQGFINACGEVQAAAYNVADKVLVIENVFTTSVHQAGGTVVAQNIGARKPERVKQLVRSALLLALGMVSITVALALLFPEEIFSLFIKNQEVLAYARPLMNLAACTFVISAVNCSVASVTTGTGNAVLKLVSGFLDGVVLRIALGLIFGVTLDMGVIGFYIAHCFARVAPLVCNLGYYFSGKWQTSQLL